MNELIVKRCHFNQILSRDLTRLKTRLGLANKSVGWDLAEL